MALQMRFHSDQHRTTGVASNSTKSRIESLMTTTLYLLSRLFDEKFGFQLTQL